MNKKIICDTDEYILEIQGQPDSLGDFDIYIPIPLDEKGLMYSIADIKIIEGKNITFEYINTFKGLALKIHTNDMFIIRAENHSNKLVCFTLDDNNTLFNNSIFEGKEIRYWIDMEGNQSNLYINIQCWEQNYKVGYPHCHIIGKISNGWQTINGRYGSRRV